jgi:FdhD protein
MREVKVTRLNVSSRTIEERQDFVAEETSIHIFLNKIHYGTILCSPSQLKELVVGHLLSEGLLKSTTEIEELLQRKDGNFLVKLKSGIDAKERISTSQRFARLVVSSCGSPTYWPLSEVIESLNIAKLNIMQTVDAEVVSQSAKKLNTIARQYRETGGVHVAALYSINGKLAALAEDVGRHNALDKVIGAGATVNLEFNDFFVALSGRLTGDIVLKAARMKIPLIASLAAAISSGLEAAQLTGVTLAGFVRGKRINVYTYPKRITLSSQKT